MFLGIQYDDCYKEEKLISVFEPYIANVRVQVVTYAPFDALVPCTIWSMMDHVIEACKFLMEEFKLDNIPAVDWFTKRGIYENRPVGKFDEKYNAGMIGQLITDCGGFVKVRKVMGLQGRLYEARTKDETIQDLKEFYEIHKLTPSAAVHIWQKKTEVEQENSSLEEKERKRLASQMLSRLTKLFPGSTAEAYKEANVPHGSTRTKKLKQYDGSVETVIHTDPIDSQPIVDSDTTEHQRGKRKVEVDLFNVLDLEESDEQSAISALDSVAMSEYSFVGEDDLMDLSE